MNARQDTEWLLMATSIGLVGTLAHTPVITVVGALAALLAIGRSGSRPAYALSASCPATPRTARDIGSGLVFRSFRRGDASPKAAKGGRDAEAGSGGKAPSALSSYEEFTAHLADDADEEIQFMPHYASDVVDSRGAAEGGGSGSGVSESLLSNDLKQVEELVSKLPVPRRFALGTVAIIRRLLEPSQVEQILMEQRRYPRLRFGNVAVQLDLLTESEVQELLVAQEEGIFADEEISDARRRLAAYHNGG